VLSLLIGTYGLITALPPRVKTSQDQQRQWNNAEENEKLLTVMLFGIISVVAIFLIFCIFYMIVVEKTRDIGIIKSVGATSTGVASIFLGYGLVIGVLGAGLGWLLSYGIVHNINMLHTELGKYLGVQIWNPEVYLFDKIPNTMSPRDVAIIVPIAVIASVLGALVPAIRAARMNPVEALRWE
jgi:lipoprotein-releasing system permease protein